MVEKITQFRIFLSSPGDVQEERESARNLIKEALPYSPFIRGRATFDVISWDDPHAAPGLDARLPPQEAINRKLPKPSECDIVVVILWSRMGTPLPSEIAREDGSTYQSGTEWEFEDAISSAEANRRPITLLFQRIEKPKTDLDDPKLQSKLKQYQKVKAFFERFKNGDCSLTGTYATYGTTEAFSELLRQKLESVVSEFLGQGFSEEFGVTHAAVKTMLGILKEQQVPPDQLEAKLKEIAERHLELTEQLHVLSKSNDEPEIAKPHEQAAIAVENGNYDRAAEALAEAVAIDRRAMDALQEELDRRKLSVAATISQQGELDRTRLNYRRAAKRFAESASFLPVSERKKRSDYLMEQASALFALGDEFGDKAALFEAVEVYRGIIVEQPRQGFPLQWAAAQHGLGNALWILGIREPQPELLRQSIEAFKLALQERTRKKQPLEWAETQNNLGRALRNLAQAEGNINGLTLAIDAFNLALEERQRENLPLKWAETTLNLGNAIWKLSEAQEGVELVEEAIETIRQAEQEFSRERSPFGWAKAQVNLALANFTLGERTNDAEFFRKSVEAFREAEKEYTRDRMPIHWAEARTNIGVGLQRIGLLESNANLLEQSIIAHEAALEVLTFERAPGGWARVQSNLGAALRSLGKFEEDLDAHYRAVDAYNEAMRVRKREVLPQQWAYSQEGLGLTYQAIAEMSRDEIILRQGIKAISSSLEVFKECRLTFASERAKKGLLDAETLLTRIEEGQSR